MKILHVARYGSVKGGTESYVRALCAAQRDAGHDVALGYRYDPDDSRPEVRDGMQLRSITSRNAEPVRREATEIRDAVASLAPDVIHIHNAEASWLPGMLATLAPTISGIHDHRLDCPTGTRFWAAWGRACDISPGAACLGFNVAAHCGSLKANATLEPYRRWRRLHAAAAKGPRIQVFSGFMRDALTKVGIAVPIDVTPYPCPQLSDATPGERAPGHVPTLFASGRVTKEKGFDGLLDALDHVRAPVELRIAGDGHHRVALMRRATRHPVRWLGWIDRDRLAQEYADATIVAVPSAWPEPFGIVGLEAGFARKPVVATGIGGIGEWLIDGVTGIAVPPRSPMAFAAAIETLIGDPAMCDRMGAAARRRIETDFSMTRHLSAVASLYEQARRSWEAAA